jgi:uncharacterized protein YbaA (DUF1428 family)
MTYIDGFVAAVPDHNKDEYIKHVTQAAHFFKKYGAKKLVECWGDDVKQGKITSFPQAVKCRDDETVVLSWVVWPSKEVRDKGMREMFEDPGVKEMTMPFDTSRLMHGGFEVILDE